MAFSRPTLQEIIDRIDQDFVSRLSGQGTALRRAMVKVLARVIAGASHMLHGHLEYVAKQPFADVADEENLIRAAALRGVTKTPATYAQGVLTIQNSAVGAVIPAGTVLVRSIDGLEYETLADATVEETGIVSFTVEALEAGEAGSLLTGQELAFQSPVAGVGSSGLIIGNPATASDEETTEDFRARFLEYLAEPPHGGNAADYVAWAKEVAGVTRAWCYPQELGPGTVTVRPIRDGDPSPIPDAGEIAAIQAHIDEMRPVTANVTVVAPVAVPQNFTVAITPDTVTTRAAVTAELADMIRRTAEPGGTLLFSDVQTAARLAAGVTNAVVTVPSADVARTTGQLTTLGTVTFA